MLDTLHLALISHSVYTYVVIDFGNIEALGAAIWYVPPHVTRSRDLIVRLLGPSG